MSVGMLRLFQLVAEICLFLLPALLIGWLCSRHLPSYLSLKPVGNAQVWGLTFAGMFLLSPFIVMTGFLNSRMTLPPFLEGLERWMQSLETSAEAITNLLLADSSALALVSNLIVIAAGAAVAEEFFFRGALRRILGRHIRNPHALIWIIAAIFSLVHFQFYGFIPRLLLGAWFGYLVWWSKSIWLAVFSHFINNGVAVIGMSRPGLRDRSYFSGQIPGGELLFFILCSLVGLALFFFCLKRLRRLLRQGF